MRFSKLFGATLVASLSIAGLGSLPVDAVRLSDGRDYFVRPPSLVDASTTQTRTAFWGATYYFTLNVPDNAGEPLQQVTIALQNGEPSGRQIRLRTDETIAFIGTRGNRQTRLTLGETTFDRDTQTATVRFDPPVPPGTTVTIGLRPERNPRLGGIYLFGVTAFPVGENPYGQFLGYGRFQFDEPDRFDFDLF